MRLRSVVSPYVAERAALRLYFDLISLHLTPLLLLTMHEFASEPHFLPVLSTLFSGNFQLK